MARLNLSSPWVLFYHEVKAMFEQDDEVNVIYDDTSLDSPKLKIYVDSDYPLKALALTRLLPATKDFGGFELQITVIPSNSSRQAIRKGYHSGVCTEITELHTPQEIFLAAFRNNKALSDVVGVSGIYSNPMFYVVFQRKVVQYFTDDLGDLNGVRSTLYQDIAKEIFVHLDGVYYCTAVSADEWLPF